MPQRVRLKDLPNQKVQMNNPSRPLFEMGSFIGLLGRDKVCAVFEPGVELPSDLEGVMRIQYAEGGTWKHNIYIKGN